MTSVTFDREALISFVEEKLRESWASRDDQRKETRVAVDAVEEYFKGLDGWKILNNSAEMEGVVLKSYVRVMPTNFEVSFKVVL